MVDINAVKAALSGCENKNQVMYIVGCIVENGKFRYDFEESIAENAIYAEMQNKHSVAECLRFASKRFEGVE